MNTKIEKMQEQLSTLLDSFESLKETNTPEEINTTLCHLQSIEQEWKAALNKLKEHEKEYAQLIKEVRSLRDSIKN